MAQIHKKPELVMVDKMLSQSQWLISFNEYTARWLSQAEVKSANYKNFWLHEADSKRKVLLLSLWQ